MTWEAWTTVSTIALIVVILAANVVRPDTALLAGLVLFMTFGLFSESALFPSPSAALSGFGNEGVITIAVLFAVAEGMRQTGAMNWVAQPLLGQPKSERSALLRLVLPIAGLSAFLNNTPIVAVFSPVVSDWCKKHRLSPSRLFIPLSYAAIMGGACTLLGTATNIFVSGMLVEAQAAGQLQEVSLGMFTITWIGLPASVAGFIYLLFLSPKLLPDTGAHEVGEEEARQLARDLCARRRSRCGPHVGDDWRGPKHCRRSDRYGSLDGAGRSARRSVPPFNDLQSSYRRSRRSSSRVSHRQAGGTGRSRGGDTHRLHRVRGNHHGRLFGQLRQPHLPDQPDGVRPWGLQVWRLPPLRSAVEFHRDGGHSRPGANHLALKLR